MNVSVDGKKCVGTGSCEETCPNIFKVVDETSQVQVDSVPKDEEDCVRKAVDGCPMGAISIS